MDAMAEEPGLRARFEAAVADFRALVNQLTPDQWRLPAANAPDVQLGRDEDRSVGHVAWHTAMAMRRQLRAVSAMAHGHQPEGMSFAELDEYNAGMAEANPDPDRDAVVQILAEEAGPLAELIGRLTPEQLKHRGQTFDRDWSLRSYVENVIIYHVRWHAASIEATIRR